MGKFDQIVKKLEIQAQLNWERNIVSLRMSKKLYVNEL